MIFLQHCRCSSRFFSIVDVARSLLASLGASLGAPEAPFSSNLVPLSLQVDVNLPLLAPTFAPTSQLDVKIGPNLPSKIDFS